MDTAVKLEPKYEFTEEDRRAQFHAKFCYIMILLTIFGGVGFIVGFSWAFIKKSDALDTYFYDHYENITKTFWISLITIGLSVLSLFIFGLGAVFVLVGGFIYVLFRVLRGLSRITRDKAYEVL